MIVIIPLKFEGGHRSELIDLSIRLGGFRAITHEWLYQFKQFEFKALLLPRTS